MAISRDAVIWGFRLVLGRDPEEDGIRAHMGVTDETALVEVLLRSPEFRASGRFASTVQLRAPAHDGAPAPAWRHQSRAALRVVIFGNCQAAGAGRLLQAMTGDAEVSTYETTPAFIKRMRDGEFPLESVVSAADLVLIQMAGEVVTAIRQRLPKQAGKIRQFPAVSYAGFHPDCVYIARQDGAMLSGPMGQYQSSIAFWAWRHGLDAAQATALFRPEVFDALGFDDHHPQALQMLLTWGQRSGLPLGELVDGWRRRGVFMHSINHPKLFALADVMQAVLRREGIEPIANAAEHVDDHLARWPVWPVYPALAERLGVAGSYDFKLDTGLCPPDKPVLSLALPEFVEASFKAFEQAGAASLSCERVDDPSYEALSGFVPDRPSRLRRLAGLIETRVADWLPSAAPPAPAPATGESPYAGLPDVRFWRRAVERVAPAELDPVVRTKFAIARDTRVATAGSCFAQNIARHLHRSGFHYLVVDDDPALAPAEAQRRGFGMYSARYGNVYTARQLVQLFDRAHGHFQPADRAWRRPDGRFVDPLRPQIEPDGFEKMSQVEAATVAHLADVRRMFAQLDVFVFTLGLTEAWRRKSDGTVFPLAPGVSGGSFDPALYEFVNFNVEDVLDDLHGFELRLRAVNPGARMIVTVSPVPLIATYEDRHVLVSTAESKAVLRAAAGRFAARRGNVDYFPSYELVTSTASRGAYFADDLRSVREEGVEHVMRVFFRHYTEGGAPAGGEGARATPLPRTALAAEYERLSEVVCDEEAIDRHRPS